MRFRGAPHRDGGGPVESPSAPVYGVPGKTDDYDLGGFKRLDRCPVLGSPNLDPDGHLLDEMRNSGPHFCRNPDIRIKHPTMRQAHSGPPEYCRNKRRALARTFGFHRDAFRHAIRTSGINSRTFQLSSRTSGFHHREVALNSREAKFPAATASLRPCFWARESEARASVCPRWFCLGVAAFGHPTK